MSEQDGQAPESQQPPKRGRAKWLILIGLPLLLLLGGGAAAFVMGMVPLGGPADPAPGAKQAARDAVVTDIVFVELPDLLLNLNLTGRRLRFLKVSAALEVEGEERAARVRQLVPRIMDSFHLYFRALRPEELEGPEGLYRIKEDLLVRTNDAVRPVQVRDVLLRELLVQ